MDYEDVVVHIFLESVRGFYDLEGLWLEAERLPLPEEKADWVRRLLLRIEGVQQVRESKYIMLHAPRSALPQIAKLLPGSESPTVIPLDGHGEKVAVHAVCRENVFWETLESLKAAGASALLVLPVEKMLP
jgi:ATP phosphoribosyltransferase